MQKIVVECYSREKGKDLLSLGGAMGAMIVSCNPQWKKKYCDTSGKCYFFFDQGTFWRDKKLSELLHKSVEKLTDDDRYRKANRFREKAYEKCRKIRITAEEVV